MSKTKPMSLPEILELLESCRAQTKAKFPDGDFRKTTLLPAFDTLEGWLRDHFPLTSEEKKQMNLGLFAAREIETFDDGLAADIQRLNFQLTKLN